MKDRTTKGLEIAERLIRAKGNLETATREMKIAEKTWDEFLNGKNKEEDPVIPADRKDDQPKNGTSTRKGTNISKIYEALCGHSSPTEYHQIAKETGIPPEHVRPALWYMKRRGMAELVDRGIWKAIKKS